MSDSESADINFHPAKPDNNTREAEIRRMWKRHPEASSGIGGDIISICAIIGLFWFLWSILPK